MSFVLSVGDLLGVRVVRTWEFNSTFPLRSIIPIYLSTAMPLLLLKVLSSLYGYVISWYMLTVAVRLMVTVLSLITDYTVIHLATWIRGGRDVVSAGLVMATSYVSLVYYSRTFSNTLESFLFASLLCFVVRKARKQNSDVPLAVIISALIVVGIFNRPTFFIYAMVPYLWWLFRDGLREVNVKAVYSVLTAVPVSVLLILSDSIYFGKLDINNFTVADFNDITALLTHNVTVTPLNFVSYNTQSGSLAEHGIHPRFTHFAVNIPLLFSVLSVGFFYDIYWWFVTAVFRQWKLVSTYWRQLMLLICCITPVSLLSIFPHQEPRFLIPLLPIFAALYGHRITTTRWQMILWIITNIAGCLFYGSVHQAGVMPCLGHLQQTRSPTVDRQMIFWHTYTAPQHLLMLPRQSFDTRDARHTSLTSLEGKSVEDLICHVIFVNSSWLGKPEVMVAAPSSEHHYLVCRAAEAGIRLDITQSFWPHLSMEYPPKIDNILCHVPSTSCHPNIDAAAAAAADDDDDDNNDADNFCNKTLIDRIMFLSSLNLYQVTFS